MDMTINWDLVDGASIKEGNGTIEIVRPVMVDGVEGVRSGETNPAVLQQALQAPGMPVENTAHPTWAGAYLEERRCRSTRSVESVIVDLIYARRVLEDGGHTNPNIWTLTDASQGSWVQTYATADGSAPILMWYLANGRITVPIGDMAPLGGAAVRSVAAKRFRGHRVIMAEATLRGDDWNDWKADVRAASFKINMLEWGEAKRGTWLFMGPTTRYHDRRRRTVHVSLAFMEEPKGHYPIMNWINERGVHPADCNAEADLYKQLGGGIEPPPVNEIVRLNGVTIASVQEEADFNSLFAFTPSL